MNDRVVVPSRGFPSNVKVTIVPSAVGEAASRIQYAISYVVDDVIAMDAGAIGQWLTPADQAKIRHVLISHSHMDHVASLPFFLDNTYEEGPDCATIYAGQATLQALQEDIFNRRIWPDFIALSETGSPFLRLVEIRPYEPLLFDLADARNVRVPSVDEFVVPAGHLKVTAAPMNHAVPTYGYVFENSDAAVAIASDTAPTEEFWDFIRPMEKLRAVILEASFPNELLDLANLAKHLTPQLFAGELAKLARPEVPVLAVHLKPKFHATVAKQIAGLNLPQVQLAQPGDTFEF